MNVKDNKGYRYAAAVVNGKNSFTFEGVKYNSKVGELTRLACVRFMNDLDKKDYEFKPDLGYLPIMFSEEMCLHWKGTMANKPLLLEPWQHFYFMNLFGWVNDLGLRRFSRSYCEVARKNGKTTMQSILGTYHISGLDTESAPQVYVGATKEAQAMLTINDAGRIIGVSPQLQSIFTTRESYGKIAKIFNPSNLGLMEAIGKDSNRQDGLDISMGIIDEFHEHKDSGTINVVESGQVARKQPMLNIITTAGFNKIYPCYSITRKAGVEVLQNTVQNDNAFYLIYTMDEEDDFDNPDNWVKANPNWGVSVEREQIHRAYKNSIIEGGSSYVNFITKHLNIWSDASAVWIQNSIIRENNYPLDDNELLGEDCFIGVDLGATEDFTSVALLFPEVNGKVVGKVLFWIPRVAMKNRRDKYDFTKFVNEGEIFISGEDVNDYTFQSRFIFDACKKYNVKAIGYDAWKFNSGLVVDLQRELGEDMCYPVKQSAAFMNSPLEFLTTQIKSRNMNFMYNHVLEWQFGNVVLEMDANGNEKPSKRKSENKIDGVASLLDAVSVYLDYKKEYGDGDLLFGLV